MRKIITIILLFVAASAFSAPKLVNRWWDSTWFGNTVQFDTTIVMKGLKVSGITDTFVVLVSPAGKLTKVGKSTFLAGLSGGGGTGTVTSVSVSTANGVSGTVANATTTPAITLSLGAITPTSVAASGSITGSNLSGTNTGDQDLSSYATKTNLTDTSTNLNNKINLKLNSSDTVAQNLGIRTDYINRLSAKQDALVSGTSIKTINSTSILGSGNIVTPDAQTLTAGTNTLTISGGNTVNLNRKVDTSYQIKNTARDSTCQITVINGISYRSCTKDTISTLTATSTTTFTNKRITARVDSTTSSATPTINTDNVDTYKLTAQSVDITSFTTNLTGTPTDDQILHIVIIGTATRAITWGAKFESSTVKLPTTTVSTNRLDVYFIWNTATSKWRCGGVW